MHFLAKTMAAAVLGLSAHSASAATITGYDPITVTGSTHNLTYTGVAPWAGGTGALTVTLNGDYSSPYLNWEYFLMSLDTLTGSIQLGAQDNVNNYSNNTISGLTYLSSTVTQFAGDDQQLVYQFGISETAMASIFADGIFSFRGTNSGDVNPWAQMNADFVSFELTYTSGPSLPAVPLPAGGTLLLGGIAALAAKRRRK